MRSLKKITGISIIFAFLMQFALVSPVFADLGDPPSAPLKLRVEPNNIQGADEPAIGYNEYDGNYVDIKWDAATFPDNNSGTYYNVYIQEINKYGAPASSPVLREADRNISGTVTSWRLRNLKSGTVYYIYVTAYYKYTTGNGTVTVSSPESVPSNVVRALTDIKIAAYTCSDSQIKIEWDDVWDVGGKRMNYKLYITDGDFANTQPIYIGQSQIEPNGPVKVNQATGKLEYTHTVGKAATVYYVKIAPDTTDDELKRNPESKVCIASTYILARTTKMASTDFGTIWRLDWSPVLKDIADTSIKIAYLIYKGTADSTQLPVYMSTVEDTSIYITVPPGEENNYYIIRASITKNGQDYYPVIIQSDRIFMKEQDVSAYPAAPELVNYIVNSMGDIIISYDDSQNNGQLKPDSATILWNAPRKGNGDVDTDVTYDIWLISDPNQIDNPPENYKLESSLKMEDSKYLVMDKNVLLGYKYTINGLTSNSTYYFKIVAKKSYVEYVDNELKTVEYLSQPSLKIIITPTEGPIDQPMIPGRPPLKVKKLPPPDNKDMIGTTSVTIQLKNMWYEVFNEDTGKWEYIRTEKLNESDIPPYDPNVAPPDNIHYRMVQYDQGVTIDVGVKKYTEGMSYNDLANIPADWITGFPVAANDADEDPSLNPDKQKHNIDIDVTGLEPNTTYVLWVRAERKSVNLVSGPSDPIIITTNPDIPPITEKPTVPAFNYYLAGDTYVDLGWDVKPGYNYYIKYGKSDNPASAMGPVKVTAQDLQDISYFRVDKLDMDTLYYFWIQAEAVNGNDSSKSEWSDSYPVKTLPIIPPATPKGFGIKNTPGAVTKNSITFEWVQEAGLEYKLEIARDINYKDSEIYDAKAASEFTVEGLRSNFRYYARLYAYDPDKKLESQPTQSITVRTARSGDDYDSDQDIVNIITGDYVVKDKVVSNNTWNIKITGVNADRLVEFVKNDRALNYEIDASNPPSIAHKIVFTISDKVFRALSGLGKSLTITTDTAQFIIRPDMLAVEQERMLYKKYDDFNFELSVLSPGTAQSSGFPNITFKTGVFAVFINAYDGASPLTVSRLNKPLKVSVPYTGSNWYKPGVTSAAMYDDNTSSWQKVATTTDFDADNNKGTLNFETMTTGNMAVIDSAATSDYLDLNYLSDDNEVKRAVIAVTALHKLKSATGRYFYPTSSATIGAAAKFMLDVMDVNYSDDYASVAAKSGILDASDISNTGLVCTREKAILMAVRVYELKTGRTAKASTNNVSYSDLWQVSSGSLEKVKFAIENGIITGRSGKLAPKDPVTRGEIIIMLQKVMALAGEID